MHDARKDAIQVDRLAGDLLLTGVMKQVVWHANRLRDRTLDWQAKLREAVWSLLNLEIRHRQHVLT